MKKSKRFKWALLLLVPLLTFALLLPVARERRRVALTQEFLRDIKFDRNTRGIKDFIAQGIDVNGTIRGEYLDKGTTALHLLALENNRESDMKLLLEHGASINARDVLGVTPLMTSVCRDISTVKFFVANGADLNIETDPEDGYGHFILRGQTALTIAKRYATSKDVKNSKSESQRMRETIRFLEAAGAKE